MKHIALATTLILFLSAGFALADEEMETSSAASAKLKDLASMPTGITVSHNPNPVRYTLDPSVESGIKWEFSTTVSAMNEPVTIVEFGYFLQRNGQWELAEDAGITYASSEFAEKYGSPGSILQLGESYTDALNQSSIDCIPEQMVKWYFIGEDAEGNRFKGEADLMVWAEHDPSENGPQF